MRAWIWQRTNQWRPPPCSRRRRPLAAASGMRSLRAMASLAEAELACATGDLAVAIEIATELLQHPWNSYWQGFVRLVSFAALLTEDEHALRLAAEAAERGLRGSPGGTSWADKPHHRLGLLHHEPSVVSGYRDPASADLLDALAHGTGVDRRRGSRCRHRSRSLLVATRTAPAGCRRCHRSCRNRRREPLARRPRCRRRAGSTAHRRRRARRPRRRRRTTVEDWTQASWLLGSAQRLRDETGYQWRFAFEQRSLNAARTAAVEALGCDAEPAEAAGRNVDWRATAADTLRTRRERAAGHQPGTRSV